MKTILKYNIFAKILLIPKQKLGPFLKINRLILLLSHLQFHIILTIIKFGLPPETDIKYKEFYKLFIENRLKIMLLHFWISVRMCLYVIGFRDVENIYIYLFFNQITRVRATHTIFQIEVCFQEESFFMFIFSKDCIPKYCWKDYNYILVSNEKETILNVNLKFLSKRIPGLHYSPCWPEVQYSETWQVTSN